ncbi:MAG: DUF2796 domain-containing protein [Pseudomonadota bacterium]
MKTKLACALAAALSTSPVFAETKALDPHVHGIATVQIVVDGNELAITLDSPAASLVGFEHAPETDAQHAAVDQMRLQLESFTGAMLINASAGCTVTESDVRMLAAMDHDDDHDEHDEHDDEHHDEHHDDDKHDDEHHDEHHNDDKHDDEHHDEHHDDDKHDDEHHDEHHDDDKHDDEHHDEHHDDGKHDDEHHDHDHDDHEGEGSVHSEIEALWLLTCESPDELATLDVLLFDGNDFLETVNAEMLLSSGPRVQTLDPSNTVLNLK